MPRNPGKGFPARLKAVVFDLDGTLLDTAPEFIDVVQTLRSEHELPPLPAERVRDVVSDGARAMVSLALDMPQDHPEFEAKRQHFLAIYAQDLGRATTPFSGISELISALAGAGVRWGVSTNKPSYLTEPLLQRLAFDPPPASVVCPDHVNRPKPDPEPLLLNCHQLNCSPGETIYIGDHRRDIEAGQAAGIYTIAAAYGYVHADEDPAAWGADSVARSSGELTKLIAGAVL
jgi:phosphoglycolate phosphatase